MVSLQQLAIISVSLIDFSIQKVDQRNLAFAYKAYDDNYIIPVPAPDKDKSYLFANTVAIMLFSGLFISVIVSFIAVAKSIVADQKTMEEKSQRKARKAEAEQMSAAKELMKNESGSNESSAKSSDSGSDRLRSVISPEMLQ